MGGAIFNDAGTVTLINSTFTGDTATGGAGGTGFGGRNGSVGQGLGGAIFSVNGSLTVDDCTLSGNIVTNGDGTAGQGGNIYVAGDSAYGTGAATVTLNNTILAGSAAGVRDIAQRRLGTGTVTDSGTNNLFQYYAGGLSFTATITGKSPLLGLLANNGGPTYTMLPGAGSPVLGAGTTVGAPSVDQRGFPRPPNGPIDIGSVQITPPPPNANGTFFTDGSNQMWEFTTTKNQFTNTNAFSELIASGVALNGNPEVYFTDGNNLIWRDVNGQVTPNGAFGAPIGAFGTRLAAGRGVLAFTDGANQVWLFNEATGQFVATGAFATKLVGGFDANGNSMFAILDGANHLYTLAIPNGSFPTTPTFVSSGASALQVSVGVDAGGTNEVWFTDGTNTVWRLDQGNFTQTTATATQIAAAQGQVFLLDKSHHIQVVTDAGVETNTGGFGTTISASPAFNGVFFLDGTNQIWMFTGGAFTNTGGFGTRITAF
jgi:hypothetical protein